MINTKVVGSGTYEYEYAMGMSLTELLVQVPKAKPIYEAVIAALNVQDKADN